MMNRNVTIGLLAAWLVGGIVSFAQDRQTLSAAKTAVSRPARIRLGGVFFSAGYHRFSGYYPFPFLYPRFYGLPWFYDPFYAPIWYHPGWYTGFAYQSGMGEIRLHSGLQDADVFLDEAFAGKLKDVKTMWLDPGAYTLKVQTANFEPFSLRVYVLSGKTLKIDVKMAPAKER